MGALGGGISRDPIGEWGGANLYGFVNNRPIQYVDTDGRLQLGEGGICPKCGKEIGYGQFHVHANPALIEAIKMYLHLYFGDHGDDYHLSTETLDQARQKICKPGSHQMKEIILAAHKVAGCGQSGYTPFNKNTDFYIENTTGIVQMGKWDLKLQGIISWKCGDLVVKDGTCRCQCSASFSGQATISKWYTFRPAGYNDYNSKIGIQFLNVAAILTQTVFQNNAQSYLYEPNIWEWYGPAYFVSEAFDVTFSTPFEIKWRLFPSASR